MNGSPEKPLTLWSIQTPEAWQQIERTGVLHTDKALCQEYCVESYPWMVEQMERRGLKRPGGCIYPVWAWYQCQNAAQKRPDLRRGGHLEKGMQGVLLTLQMEASRVLLSDFELWHYALNYWYLGETEEESEAFDQEMSQQGLDYFREKPLSDPVAHERITRSWEKIFDLDWAAPEIARPREEKMIQATFWELRREDVVKVQQFTAR